MKTITLLCSALLTVSSLCGADQASVTATLQDGSVVKGELITEKVTGQTVFLEQVDLQSQSIKEISFSKKDTAKITLTNGDCFAFTPITKSLNVTTVLGNLSVPFESLKAVKFARNSTSGQDGLIFHCSFDSKEAVEQPSVGPAGTFLSGEFVEGKHGKALALEALNFGAAFDLPENFIGKSGCIEFWAKITKRSSTTGNGGDPRFFNISRQGTDDPHRALWFDTEIVDNDGGGNSGVCFRTYYGHVASNFGFGHRLQYFDLLPEPWNEWHHYALSWDFDGIQLNNGVNTRSVLFIDGKPEHWLKSRPFDQRPSDGELQELIALPKTLAFTWNHRHLAEHCTKSPFIMDEFKIWNFAKTEFELQ